MRGEVRREPINVRLAPGLIDRMESIERHEGVDKAIQVAAALLGYELLGAGERAVVMECTMAVIKGDLPFDEATKRIRTEAFRKKGVEPEAAFRLLSLWIDTGLATPPESLRKPSQRQDGQVRGSRKRG